MDVGGWPWQLGRPCPPSDGAVITAGGVCVCGSCALRLCTSGAPSVRGTWPSRPAFLPDTEGGWLWNEGGGRWSCPGWRLRWGVCALALLMVGQRGGRARPGVGVPALVPLLRASAEQTAWFRNHLGGLRGLWWACGRSRGPWPSACFEGEPGRPSPMSGAGEEGRFQVTAPRPRP